MTVALGLDYGGASISSILDLHGEYTAAFGDNADIISANDIELPYRLMNTEELLGLMIDTSEADTASQVQGNAANRKGRSS